MNDLFPSGTMTERAEWSRRRPWLAGFYWSLLMCPLWALILWAALGARGTAVATSFLIIGGICFVGGWLLFTFLLKHPGFTERILERLPMGPRP